MRTLYWIETHKDIVNFEKYSSKIKAQYPESFDLFETFQCDSENSDFINQVLGFFNTQGFEIKCFMSNSEKYYGTFNAQIHFLNNRIIERLGRKKGNLRYQYFSSFESGMRKVIFKGFEIVHLLLNNQLHQEKRRKRISFRALGSDDSPS